MVTSAQLHLLPAQRPSAGVTDVRNRPLRDLRLSVTDRCNLRCAYCMPEEEYDWLARDSFLTFKELATLVEAFSDAIPTGRCTPGAADRHASSAASCRTRRSCPRPLRRQDVHPPRRGRRLREGGWLRDDWRARSTRRRWLTERACLCRVLARRDACAGACPDASRRQGRTVVQRRFPGLRVRRIMAAGSSGADPHDGGRRVECGRPPRRPRAG